MLAWSRSLDSEDRDRVPRRASPSWQAERQPYHHELVATLLFAGCDKLLELQAVRDEHAHRRNLQRMDRIGDAVDKARNRLAVTVGQERRNSPLVHPGDRVDVQACLTLADRGRAVVPSTKLESPSVVSCAEDEDVTLADLDALRSYARLKLCTSHHLPRFQPPNTSELRDVEQHAASDDALVVGSDVLFGCAIRPQHFRRWTTVVRQPVV